ncbi:hypothetical protein AeRB84_002669 [Aphanomyces euteiches]|nr:hypothetical protein AeRB84_002669 [Aphanomyces euteiches]
MRALVTPRDDLAVCLFTAASDKFWGASAAQVPPEDLMLLLEDQRHQSLALLSGTFSDKLQRWALVMSTFPYTIEYLPGEAILWGDLLSRWGATLPSRAINRVNKMIHVVSPLQMFNFEWPTAASILEEQRA